PQARPDRFTLIIIAPPTYTVAVTVSNMMEAALVPLIVTAVGMISLQCGALRKTKIRLFNERKSPSYFGAGFAFTDPC
ncbi:MAG: hypothetical protein M3Y57_18340, partial [Acidobacteriota bacterium]|nr:hypothetical protein [Acidobacteriota bacterium]